MNQVKHHHRLGHILFMLGIFMFLIGVTIMTPLNNGTSRAFGVSDIIRLSNEAREQLNRKPLSTDSKLMNAAQMKAEDMAKQQFFAHTAPDGTVAWDYFKKVGYAYEIAGENLAITNETAEAVINGWLNSTTHRENLLNSRYKDFGIGMATYGTYQGHNNTSVIVALYGSRSAAQVPTAATNPAGSTTAFKPKIPTLPAALIASIAILLIMTGIILELRHIQHLHHAKSLV